MMQLLKILYSGSNQVTAIAPIQLPACTRRRRALTLVDVLRIEKDASASWPTSYIGPIQDR